MSQVFGGYKDLIEEGDLVILQISHDDRKVITVKDGEITQTAKGAIRHSGLIGYKYGKKFIGTIGPVFPLHPTPELWTLSLPHRTQIIYSHDIALIVNELDLKPGSVVLESGTGSGSLTHALARAVSPNGKVHTCEFHKERAKCAKQEFADHNISDVVNVYYRDVCVNKNSSQSTEILDAPEAGFPENTEANAVILDVPKPELALEGAYNTMKKTEKMRFCSFSPCIEQVQKTVYAAYQLWGDRVREMSSIEFGMKNHNIKNMKSKMADLGLDEAQKDSLLGLDDSIGVQHRPTGYLETYEVILDERKESYRKGEPKFTGKKSKPSENGESVESSTKLAAMEAARQKNEENKGKTDENGEKWKKNLRVLENGDEIHMRAKKMKLTTIESSYTTAVCTPPTRVYGHTGYLTFFSLIPETALPEVVKKHFTQSSGAVFESLSGRTAQNLNKHAKEEKKVEESTKMEECT